MRESYKEKALLLKQSTQTQQLEERNEQLQAEKERLQYENALQQRRVRPSQDDDDRSAIRRGLLAGPAAISIDVEPSEEGASRLSNHQPPVPPSLSPSLPPGAPSSACSSADSEQLAAEVLADMARRGTGSAGARQSADSFIVEVVEPQSACTMQQRAAGRPEEVAAGWPWSTKRPARDDRTTDGSDGSDSFNDGRRTAPRLAPPPDHLVGQSPSLPPLALDASVSQPAGWGHVQAGTQRFWQHWVEPSSGRSAMAVAAAGAQRALTQSFTFASYPVRRLLGQQQSFGYLPAQHQQPTIPDLGQLQQQQLGRPWFSQPQLPFVATDHSSDQAALERLLWAQAAAQQQLQQPAAATAVAVVAPAATAPAMATAQAAAAATAPAAAATIYTNQAKGPSLAAGSTCMHNETSLVRPVPSPRTIPAACTSTLEEKFMKYVMCDYTPRWATPLALEPEP